MLNITEEQRKALLNYMARRPYAEVYELISMIMSLKPNKPESKNEGSKKDLS